MYYVNYLIKFRAWLNNVLRELVQIIIDGLVLALDVVVEHRHQALVRRQLHRLPPLRAEPADERRGLRVAGALRLGVAHEVVDLSARALLMLARSALLLL